MEGRRLLLSATWFRFHWFFITVVGSEWALGRITRYLLSVLMRFAFSVFVPYFRVTSVFGFALLLNIVTQMWSGLLLAMYYVPDPSFVLTFREEYMNEVWWYPYVYKLHIIGVDTIFVLSYLHILKKIYLKNFAEGDQDGWFTGAYAFLIYHLVVFLGITLSSNHLGDVTITIAANIF
jgi:quinol-cytochrome oxidoreductase complex cytochrome b subunit